MRVLRATVSVRRWQRWSGWAALIVGAAVALVSAAPAQAQIVHCSGVPSNSRHLAIVRLTARDATCLHAKHIAIKAVRKSGKRFVVDDFVCHATARGEAVSVRCTRSHIFGLEWVRFETGV